MKPNLSPSMTIAAVAGVLSCALSAHAQTNCNQSVGPDLIFADVASPPTNYASQNGIDAFAAGSVYANIGTAPVQSDPSFMNANHPLTGQGLFRLKTVNGSSRIEQIGMMWLHDVFCPIGQDAVCVCQDSPNCETLGVGCSSPDTSGINGVQSFLRPRWQVNAAAGTFPPIGANPPFSGTVARRLQAKHGDLNPAQNGGGQYYVEMFILAGDDTAAGNAHNNFSYRPCNITGGPSEWLFSLAGTTQREKPAISAWKASDPNVLETVIDVPGDGRFIVAAKATELGGGAWHYEYAVENLNSDLSGRSFAVPLPTGAVISNIAFHDVDYHSGDGLGNVTTDGTDWPANVAGGHITWATQDFASNPNANALRFATLYNFRFDCDAAPQRGSVTLSTFKIDSTVNVATIVPGAPACVADLAPQGNPDHTVDVNDLLALISGWGPCPLPCVPYCEADIAHDCEVDVTDLLAMINAWGPCQ